MFDFDIYFASCNFSSTTSLLRSTHECSLGIKDNKVKFSECTEVHTFKPFSASEGKGAITEQRQTLRLISEEPNQIPNAIGEL